MDKNYFTDEGVMFMDIAQRCKCRNYDPYVGSVIQSLNETTLNDAECFRSFLIESKKKGFDYGITLFYEDEFVISVREIKKFKNNTNVKITINKEDTDIRFMVFNGLEFLESTYIKNNDEYDLAITLDENYNLIIEVVYPFE